MSISEKEDLAACPYNPSHKIAKFKLLPHVHRCKDGLKSTKKLYHCKKDSLIMFFADKKEDHTKECHYCFNIYNNLNSNANTLNNSNFSIAVKKKQNYFDDQKSISLLTGTDDSKTITLNLDEMSELNASILSTPSILGGIINDRNRKFDVESERRKDNNEIKYQFYKKGDIIEGYKLINANCNNYCGGDIKQQKVNSYYSSNKQEMDLNDCDLDETKFSRKI